MAKKQEIRAPVGEICELPLDKIDPFPDHPYKVVDDEDMDQLVESIRAKGIISPCIVRKTTHGRYELVSGHRRMHACKRLGMDTLRCEVLDITKEEATVLMVESNFQRDKLLPSEKAFAYKMRLEAMKLQISRMKTRKNSGLTNYAGESIDSQLEKEEKRYGVLYCVQKDRSNKDPNAAVDVIARAEDASKVQRITERFRLTTKIATAISTGFIAYDLAVNDLNFKDGEGLVVEDIEESISRIGRMGREGMRSTDEEILNMMLGY